MAGYIVTGSSMLIHQIRPPSLTPPNSIPNSGFGEAYPKDNLDNLAQKLAAEIDLISSKSHVKGNVTVVTDRSKLEEIFRGTPTIILSPGGPSLLSPRVIGCYYGDFPVDFAGTTFSYTKPQTAHARTIQTEKQHSLVTETSMADLVDDSMQGMAHAVGSFAHLPLVTSLQAHSSTFHTTEAVYMELTDAIQAQESTMPAANFCNEPEQAPNGDDALMDTPQPPKSALKRSAPAPSDSRKKKQARVRFAEKSNNLPGLIDYTSEDDRIIALKRQGHDDTNVAHKLRQEGRKRTTKNAVNNRWIKLRKALAEREEELLDDELSDWHADEDEKLHNAHMLVQDKLHKEIEAIKARMWKEVSTDLAKRMERRKYTAKACQERFEGLVDGSALTPIELDSDQEGRDVLRQTRITEAKRIRDDHYYDLHCAHNQQLADIAAAKSKKGSKKHEYLAEIKKRQDEKAAMERVKQERKESQRAKQELLEEKQRCKDEQQWPEMLLNAELEALDDLLRRPAGTSAKEAKLERRQSSVNLSDDTIDLASSLAGEDEDDAIARAQILSRIVCDQLSRSLGLVHNLAISPLPIVQKKPAPTFGLKATPGSIPISRESLLNPRSIMPADELEILFKERNLPRRSKTETQPQMVARLAFEDEALTQRGLLDLLAKYFDKGKAGKDNLIWRLQNYDVNNCESTLLGSSSDDIGFMLGYEGYTGEFRYLVDIYSGAIVGMAAPSSPFPNYSDDDDDVVMGRQITVIKDEEDATDDTAASFLEEGYGLLAAIAGTCEAGGNDTTEMIWGGSGDEDDDALAAFAAE
ncbi:hypothetical protein MBLNU230_g2081t1 [Neophaeotheca triangularis]